MASPVGRLAIEPITAAVLGGFGAVVIVLVVAWPPFLRPAPEVPGHPLDHIPELELGEPLRRDAFDAVDQPEQVPGDGA